MKAISGPGAIGATRQSSIPLYPSAYIGGTVTAEGLVAFVDPLLGLAMHAVVLLGLLTHYSVHSGRETDPGLMALPAIGLLPLMRILSAAMPVKGVDPVYWPVLTGIPLLVAMLLVARPWAKSRRAVGLTVASWSQQAFIGLTGVGLGIIGFYAAPAEPVFAQNGMQTWIPLAAVIVFAGLLEEVLFRGLVRERLAIAGSMYSQVATSLLFAAFYLGSGGSAYLAFIAATGLYFGWCTQRTGSVVGVCLAHAAMKLGIFLVWPLVLA